jgi:competence protein ComEC
MTLLFLSTGIVAAYHSSPKAERGKLEITAIDVGQGDSLLVISPEGRTMLIDGGGSIGPVHSEFDFGEDVVAPYLWSRGIEHLDVVVLTHAHGDHIGGLPRIIEDFHPSELWIGINPDSPPLQQLYAIAAENHVAVRQHTAGDELDWGGTKIRVLSPPADWRPKAQPKNDDSLALLIRYGDTSALLAGDLEKKMERFVATEAPAANLLKIAHHGSATSTTPELLAAVHPQFAVISVGYRNSFKHPRQEVLDRLQAGKVLTYRTDLFGAVTFLLDGKQVQARLPAQLDAGNSSF